MDENTVVFYCQRNIFYLKCSKKFSLSKSQGEKIFEFFPPCENDKEKRKLNFFPGNIVNESSALLSTCHINNA